MSTEELPTTVVGLDQQLVGGLKADQTRAQIFDIEDDKDYDHRDDCEAEDVIRRETEARSVTSVMKL